MEFSPEANSSRERSLRRQIRCLLLFFIAGLVLSGLTAFPIQTELAWGLTGFQIMGWAGPLTTWLTDVYIGVSETNANYPFIAYGTDWLAFAHLVLAVLFIGPLKDPVKNIWVIEFGIIACIGVFPLALIAGPIRGIPFLWQLVDCSFGVFGGLLMLLCYVRVKALATIVAAMPPKSSFQVRP